MLIEKLPKEGVSPSAYLEHESSRTYTSYNGGNEVVEKYLFQHPREAKEDFTYRKLNSYSFERTEWATRFITRTINNKKYPIYRSFNPKFTELERLAISKKSNGKTWDSILKEITIDSLLGGISYLYLNIGNIKTILSGQTNIVETNVLRYNQVSNIVLNRDGFISQCKIQFSVESTHYILLYYFDNDEPIFKLFASSNNSQWELIESGINILGFAPIVPLVFIGSIDEPKSITSPIQKISKIDMDIMNLYSDSRNAFGFHNYPWIALPAPEGGIEGTQIGLNRDDENPNNNSLQKVALGPAQGFYYDSNVGEPKIIEPSNVHIEQTTKLIDYLEDEILNILGAGIDKDHPLASGISKMFTFNNTNELYRYIHSRLEYFEYNVFYIASLLLDKNRIIDFSSFEDEVIINHPVNFDPTGSNQLEKVKNILDSNIYNNLNNQTKELIVKKYLELSLSESISSTELSELLETVNFEDIENQENTNANTDSTDIIEEPNQIIQPNG